MSPFDPRVHEGRVRSLYARRDAAGLRELYADTRGEMIAWRETRLAAVQAALRVAGIRPVDRPRILDVGCGTGSLLLELSSLGMDPSRLIGIDLLEDRLKEGRGGRPQLNLVLGSGWALPVPHGILDLVTVFTVLSSLPDEVAREALGREVRRVLRPGAHVIVYDFRIRRPGRTDLVGIGRGHVEDAFRAPVVWRRSLTLAPPIARVLGRFGPTGVRAVERFAPAFRTHRMYLIRV